MCSLNLFPTFFSDNFLKKFNWFWTLVNSLRTWIAIFWSISGRISVEAPSTWFCCLNLFKVVLYPYPEPSILVDLIVDVTNDFSKSIVCIALVNCSFLTLPWITYSESLAADLSWAFSFSRRSKILIWLSSPNISTSIFFNKSRIGLFLIYSHL